MSKYDARIEALEEQVKTLKYALDRVVEHLLEEERHYAEIWKDSLSLNDDYESDNLK